MTASETGHIVFSTLHTINAGQTVNRILGMFSREEETTGPTASRGHIALRCEPTPRQQGRQRRDGARFVHEQRKNAT
jgi:Tfp pilus assembly pilus retraction ATPase PilT